MANDIRSVIIEPNMTSSGRAVGVLVTYETEASGKLTITPELDGWKVSPSLVDAPMSVAGVLTISLTITRTSSTQRSCPLRFSLLGDEEVRRVWVT